MRLHRSVICGALAAALACGAQAAPDRVVSTNLCTDEYVFRMVPRANIAALSFEATDRHPVVSTIADAARGLRTIRPSTETILALKPGLVVMFQGTLPLVHASLARLGIPVLDLPYASTIADVRRVTRMMGDRLGARGKAEAMLKEMDARLAHARATAPKPAVTALIYEPNGYAAGDALSGELMEEAGLRDVTPAALLTRRGTLPVEAVIAAAPELLILSGDPGARDAEAYVAQHHPALGALAGRTAIRWARLTSLMCAGPWSAEAAQTFATLARAARRN